MAESAHGGQEMYDIVVVGAGVAGWTAARRAQQLGLRPVVLEKHTAGPGWGNGRISGGYFHAAYRTPTHEPEVLYEELMHKTAGHARSELVRVWADNVLRAVEFLRDEGGEFAPIGEEEYVQNVLHPVRTIGIGRDFKDKGPDKLLTSMWRRFGEESGVFRPGRRATSLVVEDGRVVGVTAETAGGSETYLGRAIVLCDGGFQANPELVGKYITQSYKLRGALSDTGDALQMGLAIGAKAVNLEWFYGHVLSRDAVLNDALWPGLGLSGLIHVSICVDGNGRRFTDESEGEGDEILADRISKCSTPGCCWLVFDDDVWQGEAAQGPLPLNPNLVERAGGTVLSADSIEELADQAGLPAGALAASVEDFNAYASGGTAPAVPRSGRPRAIVTPPFHGIPAIAGITFAMGGLLVNEHAQVLDEDEQVIPGLYAAGGSMGGLQGGPGFGYSGGWSEASTFGLLAAEHVAATAALN